MGQTQTLSGKKIASIGVVVVAVIAGLFAWNQHRQAQSKELVIGITPAFANTLLAAGILQSPHCSIFCCQFF